MKDYANQTSRPRSTKNRKSLITAIIILLLILMPLLMHYFRHQKITLAKTPNKTKPIANKKNNATITTKQKATSKKQTAQAQTQFDFYTLLPSVKVDLPTAPTQTNLPLNNQDNNTYILQVASIQNLSEAKHLQSQLQSLGYRSFIQHYRANSLVWYRINVGPYKSLNKAEQRQRDLYKNKLDSLLLTLKNT